MAKVLQVIDVDSNGHCVRLDDGRVIVTPHGGGHPQVGEEFAEPKDAGALMVEKLKESHQAEVNEAINVIIQQRGRICDLEQQLEESKDIRTKLEAEIKQLSGLKAPTIEQLNSDVQAQAQDLSAVVVQSGPDSEGLETTLTVTGLDKPPVQYTEPFRRGNFTGLRGFTGGELGRK